ncbi:MAG: ABC transporter permease [Cytophagia bacterium]|nr:MAG: ABC transporter permease [Cytophagales bacterium]TAG35329.1 MAG: ABC transporter permease [Cytophagia bacterium]TAG72966.1 MAG: ABC transporter permease [Runella slithyformis]TAG77228.1 MAG: ABC transporter permease [Cytophagales bacterium]
MVQEQEHHFANSIKPHDSLFDLRLGEIWRYRDLLVLFVQRDFVAKYKQTILGPLWFFIQPIFQTITLAVVFGGMAKLSTDGIPPILFYLAGVTAWNYFSNCLRTTSNTFTANAGLFGKVYFPRAITPLSIIVSNLIQFGIGLFLFLLIYGYYLAIGYPLKPNSTLLLLPLLVVIMGFMGLGLGMLVSALTTKYRDLQFLVEFGVQLLMYATPVILPLSAIPAKYQPLMLLNPMTGVIETFKYGFFGTGTFSWALMGYSAGFTVVAFLLGLVVFNYTEKNFMDVV